MTQESTEKQIFVIDSSQLNDWDLCHYKYYLKYIIENGMGLHPIQREHSLDIGTVVHELLRVYYLLKRNGGITHDKIVQSCIKRGRIFVSQSSDLSAEDIEFVLYLFKEYCSYYENEQWIPLDIELPFVEKAFEDENYLFLVQGRIDLVVKIPSQPDPIIVDHKTRSRIKEESKLDNQKIIYSKFLGINTFLVNKFGLLKTKSNKERFQRDPVSYTEDYIEEWYEEFVKTLKEIIAYQKINFYKRNATSCDKWAGCTFKQWCNSDRIKRRSLINMTYKVGEEKWDVGKTLEKRKELVK